jgi:nucleotide-binding universal stress UspA family protein
MTTEVVMGRCLVVANQTLGGEALDQAVADCIRRGVTTFHVVVPRTGVQMEEPAWTGGFVVGDVGWVAMEDEVAAEERTRRFEAALAEAQRRAEQRLAAMITKIEQMGGQADGEIGADDPLQATRTALEAQAPVDEVIVSTLPSGLSRWLRMDLPNRIARLTDVPVTTLEATAEAGPDAT